MDGESLEVGRRGWGEPAYIAEVAKAAVAKEAMRASWVEKDAARADVVMISGEQWIRVGSEAAGEVAAHAP